MKSGKKHVGGRFQRLMTRIRSGRFYQQILFRIDPGKYIQQLKTHIQSDRFRKSLIMNIPYVMVFIFADRASCLYRISEGENVSEKMLYTMGYSRVIFQSVMPSFHGTDLLFGACVAVVFKLVVLQKMAEAKKLRKGTEYGSARWSA